MDQTITLHSKAANKILPIEPDTIIASMTIQCRILEEPDQLFPYCPSYAAAIAFAVIFGILTVSHIVQAVLYRKRFCAVLIMGGSWEFAGFIIRILAVQDQDDEMLFIIQQLLILLAPLWVNAFVYMTLGRMIHFHLVQDTCFGIKSRYLTKAFVCFDIVAFIIQLVGGTMATGQMSAETIDSGLDVYTAGIGVQLFFIVVFLAIAVRFRRKLQICPSFGTVQRPIRSRDNMKRLLNMVYLALALIIFRNIYRLIEFSDGTNSALIKNEWYMYVFDATPMSCAFVVFNITHPGQLLQGPRSDFSEENSAIKQAKKQKKVGREDCKEAKKGKEGIYKNVAVGIDLRSQHVMTTIYSRSGSHDKCWWKFISGSMT